MAPTMCSLVKLKLTSCNLRAAMCCDVSQYLQCVAVFGVRGASLCNLRVAVCCSVLQCLAVCCKAYLLHSKYRFLPPLQKLNLALTFHTFQSEFVRDIQKMKFVKFKN